jgi:hypothetical protein
VSDEHESVQEQPEESEGIRSLREANKRLEKQLKAIETEKRVAAVTSAFEAANVPPGLVEFYPADASTDPDAVAAWASERGIQVTTTPAAAPEQDTYNQLVDGAYSPTTSENADLYRQLNAGMGRVIDNKYLPKASDVEDAQAMAEQVNALNRLMEREVRMGRAKPFGEAGMASFGGRFTPPRYADKAAIARGDL